MVSLGLLILSWRERVRDVLRLGFRTRDSLRALPEPSFPSLISLPDVASEFMLQKSRDPITEVCNSECMRDEMENTALIYEQRNTPVTRGPSWCCLFIRNMLLKCTEGNEFNINGALFQQRLNIKIHSTQKCDNTVYKIGLNQCMNYIHKDLYLLLRPTQIYALLPFYVEQNNTYITQHQNCL